MTAASPVIAIVGGGMLGGTVLAGLLRSGVSADAVVVAEKREERAEELRSTYGVRVLPIAEAVADAVPNGCSLLLNIGTTTEAIARALLKHEGLRVITNNLNVAAILSANSQSEVIVVGGVVRGRDQGIVGEAAVDFIRQFKVDIGLIGISAIESDGSLRDFDYREVKVSQTIISHAREVWLAADASKFNRAAMVEVARLSRIDRVFSDAIPPEPFMDLMAEAEVRFTLAGD